MHVEGCMLNGLSEVLSMIMKENENDQTVKRDISLSNSVKEGRV